MKLCSTKFNFYDPFGIKRMKACQIEYDALNDMYNNILLSSLDEIDDLKDEIRSLMKDVQKLEKKNALYWQMICAEEKARQGLANKLNKAILDRDKAYNDLDELSKRLFSEQGA